jgi:hypothetical protein
MTTERAVRRSLMTAAMLSALTLAGVSGALAESNVYKDIRKPNGHDRTSAIKLADSRACGASKQRDLPPDIAGFNACMYAHGWALDHVIPDPPLARDGNDHDFYDNVAKKARGDAALSVDTRFCISKFGAPKNGAETSSAFKQCMLGRGWQYSYTQRAPVSSGSTYSSYSSAPSSDSPSSSIDNSAAQAAQAMNDAAQAQFNADMTATQNFNTYMNQIQAGP